MLGSDPSEVFPGGEEGGLNAVAEAHLIQHGGDVVLNGAFGEVEFPGDFLVGGSGADEYEDFPFTGAELAEEIFFFGGEARGRACFFRCRGGWVLGVSELGAEFCHHGSGALEASPIDRENGLMEFFRGKVF